MTVILLVWLAWRLLRRLLLVLLLVAAVALALGHGGPVARKATSELRRVRHDLVGLEHRVQRGLEGSSGR